MSLTEGAIVGTYRILGKLGEGGMGTVYRAVDTMIQREVAIKALRPDIASQPDLMDRFRSEAALLAKLNHPAIAQLYSFFSEAGTFYMAMEYVAGDTFEKVIQQGAMEWTRAFYYTSQILDGLAHAHAAGIMHRDLKPANVMRTPNDKIKLMDFGIAQALGGARLTRQGRIIGTLEYLAPERIQGKPPDMRSDLYSVGVMLFEMLSGRLPFQSDSEYELLQMQIQQPPPEFSTLGIQLPDEVVSVVKTSLEKDPARRFADAEEFSAALTALMPQRKTGSRNMPSPLLQGAAPVAAAAAAAAPSSSTSSSAVWSNASGAAAATRLAPEPEPMNQAAVASGAAPAGLLAKPLFWLSAAGGLLVVAGGILYATLHQSPRVTIAETNTPIYHPQPTSTTLPINTTPVVIVPTQKPPSKPAAETPADQPPARPPAQPPAQPVQPRRPAENVQRPQQPVPTQPAPSEPEPLPLAPAERTPPPASPTERTPPPTGYTSTLGPERTMPPGQTGGGPIVRLSDAHSVFVAGTQSELDALVRFEIQRQLGMRLRLAPTLAAADVVMRVTMEEQRGGKISSAGRVLGVKDHAQVRAVIFDAHTSRVIWQQGEGDRKPVLGAFQGESLRRLAERIVKDLRDAMSR